MQDTQHAAVLFDASLFISCESAYVQGSFRGCYEEVDGDDRKSEVSEMIKRNDFGW
jgi:hypothetical protein